MIGIQKIMILTTIPSFYGKNIKNEALWFYQDIILNSEKWAFLSRSTKIKKKVFFIQHLCVIANFKSTSTAQNKNYAFFLLIFDPVQSITLILCSHLKWGSNSFNAFKILVKTLINSFVSEISIQIRKSHSFLLIL